jgi:hypothetical protein
MHSAHPIDAHSPLVGDHFQAHHPTHGWKG